MGGVQEFNDVNDFKAAIGGEPDYKIDFETYGDGSPVVGEPIVDGNEWLNLGIQFAEMEIGFSMILSEKAGIAVSPTHSLATAGLSPGNDRSSRLITFSTPVMSFGSYIVDNETTSTSEKIILKDKYGNTIEEFAMPVGPAQSKDFRGYLSSIPIAEIHILEANDNEGASLDDVMWNHCAEFNDVNDFKAAIGGEPDYKIDFETYGDGSPVVGEPIVDGNEWLNLGIQFDEMEIGFSMILSEKAGIAVSPTHALATAGLSPGNDRSSRLITFSTPVISFGSYIVDNETTSTSEKIILKDKYGNIIKEFAMPVGPALSKDFRGYLSSVPIAEVRILEANDGEGALLDDVMYSVPILISIPNGGEVFISGTSQTIEWSSSAPADANVLLEYSINNGQDWNDVNTSTEDDGSYEWVVPEVTSNQCLVRISDVNDANIYDTSDNVFTIFQCLGPIPGDLNNDCYVDFLDFSIFAEHWLHTGNPLDSASGIVAYWSFDNTSNPGRDDSGNGNDGTLIGDTNCVDGIAGKGLYFDGNGDYVDVPSSNDLSFNSPSQAFSTSCWIRPDTITPVVQAILENEDDYLVSIDEGLLRYRKSDSGNLYHNVWQSTNPEISAGSWSHIAITYDGTGAGGTKMYVNGEEKPVTTHSYDGGGSASGDDFAIGIRAYDFASEPYGGEIDEVRIYNRVLTTTEIEYLYENP